jgi:O-antigen/teichoic acid export membrane protein
LLKDLKYTIKHSAIYGISRISLKLVSFILFPLYSILFTVEEYGVIVRAEYFWQLLSTFLLFAFETAIIRWYSTIKKDQDKRTLIFSAFSFLIFLNLILLSIALIYKNKISIFLFESDTYSDILLICMLISLTETLIGIPLTLLRIKEKVKYYVGSILTGSFISLALQIFALYYIQNKLFGIFFAKFIASFIVLIILMPYLIKRVSFKINLKLLKEVLIFAIPLMFASLVSMLLNGQDKYILGSLINSREVGLYGLGYNIAGIIHFVFLSPFALAFPIIFWRKIHSENANRFFTKTVTYSVFVITWGAIVLSIFSLNFIKIFALNADYWSAVNIVPIIAFSYVLANFHTVGFMSFYYQKKTNIVLYILLASTIVNFFLNLLLIPYLEMYGAAIATYLSYLVSVILIHVFSKKYYYIKWEINKIILVTITGIFLTLPFYLFEIENLFLSIFLKISVVISFPLILYYLNFYDKVEIQTFMNLLKSKIFNENN